MNIDPMKIGVIGCGVISAAYLKGAAASPCLAVKSVADLTREAAERQAAAFEVGAASIDELLADPEIELVVNLTVPNAHFDVSRSILSAGKHVYSEKPLTVDVGQAKSLLAFAREKGLRVGCAPDTFLGASHQASRKAVDDGRIGRIVGGTLAFLSRGMEAWHPNPDFFFKPGGGPILDLAPYYVTQLVNLAGPVATVSATAGMGYAVRIIGSGPRAGEQITVETPTSVSALLTLESGARITLDASWDVWKHGRLPIELYGTEGTLQVPDPNFFAGTPVISVRDGEWQDIDISDRPFHLGNRTLRSGKLVADYRTIGVADMAAAIRFGRPHRASGELALHVLDVLQSIGRAATEQRSIAIETTCERPALLATGTDETVFAASEGAVSELLK